MKTKLLFLLPLFCLAIQGYSQEPVFSVTGGFNFAKWKLDHQSNANHSRLGIVFGAAVDVPFKDEISFQSGLQCGMFGTHLKGHGEEAKYKTSYLLIPMLAKYQFKYGISVHAGPELGFLLSAKSDLDGDEYDFKEEMKKMDVFFVLGAEYALKSGLKVGFRIHHGLTNVENGASTSIHNRGFSLLAAYPIKNVIK